MSAYLSKADILSALCQFRKSPGDTEAFRAPSITSVRCPLSARRFGVQAPARVTTTTLQAPSKLLRAKDGPVKTKQVRNRTQVWIQRRLFNMATSFNLRVVADCSANYPNLHRVRRSLAPAVHLPSQSAAGRFFSFLRKSRARNY